MRPLLSFVHSELVDSLRSGEKIHHSRKFEILIASATPIILFVALQSQSSSVPPLRHHLANPIYRVSAPHLRESRDFIFNTA